jgi:hypothetical protein
MTKAKSLFRAQKRNRNRRKARRNDATLVFKDFVRALERLHANESSGARAFVAASREKP